MIKIHARVTKEISITEEQAKRLILRVKGEDVDISDITGLFRYGIDSGLYEEGYIPIEWLELDLHTTFKCDAQDIDLF